jgi:hypothetical protein
MLKENSGDFIYHSGLTELGLNKEIFRDPEAREE